MILERPLCDGGRAWPGDARGRTTTDPDESTMNAITRRTFVRGFASIATTLASAVVTSSSLSLPWLFVEPGLSGRPRIRVIGIGEGGRRMLESIAVANLRGLHLMRIAAEPAGLPQRMVSTWTERGRGAVVVVLLAGSDGAGLDVAAQIGTAAKDAGVLSVAVVSMPSTTGDTQCPPAASRGVCCPTDCVDTVVLVPNESTGGPGGLVVASPGHSLVHAAAVGVVGAMAEIADHRGICGVDLMDVRDLLHARGLATVGMGTSTGGGDRFVTAARSAIIAPTINRALLGSSTALLVTVTSSSDVVLGQAIRSVEYVVGARSTTPKCVWAWNTDDSVGDRVDVTVLAAGGDHLRDGGGHSLGEQGGHPTNGPVAG